MQRLGILQRGSERAYNRDFKSIQNPGDAEADNDEKMKPAPG
jgi:hypothetical protein